MCVECEKKLEKAAAKLMDVSSPSSTNDTSSPSKTAKRWQMSLQMNASWRNEKAYAKDTLWCLDMAKVEATRLFATLVKGKLEPGTKQQSIVDRCNKNHTGEEREGSREKHILKVRTV